MEKLNVTQEWDKVFPKSDKVEHKKVTFCNRYGITLSADMYTPKSAAGKLPAISARRLTASSPAITRNCSSSRVPVTPISMIGWM